MNPCSPWQLVQLDAAHSSEIRALFEQVFGHPMSEALWHWKYADHRGLATGTRDRSGRLLAHYGGTARTLWVQGQPVAVVQLGDVMVAPDARGFLSRNGPFAVATQGFLQQHVGPDRPFALGFGFPGTRHVRLGEKLGLYAATNEVQELLWPLLTRPAKLKWHLCWQLARIDWASAHTTQKLDQLWQAMQSQTTHFVIGQRNALWWQHRFANHPESRYCCFWLRQRFSGRIVGALALKPSAEAGQAWELLDWIAPLPQTAAVVQAARTIAAQAGSTLQGWLSSPVADLLRQQPTLDHASTQHACTACVTTRQRAHLPPLTQCPWWLTGGDTDFR